MIVALLTLAAAFPTQATYLTPSRAIRVVGYADARQIFERLDELFAARHPGFVFQFEPSLTRAAASALARGDSAFAPMGAEFEDAELAAYRRAAGSEPLAIGIAHDPVNAQAKSGPIGIFVHPGNPLASLTTAEVARIFARAGPGEEISTWGKLGLAGAWRDRPIRPCGVPFGVGIGVFMRAQFGGKPAAAPFLAFPQSEQILRYIAAHPDAIGYARMNLANASVKPLAIDSGDGRGPVTATAASVAAGRYAYDRRLLLYVRQPVEPWIREFIRFVLSPEGQAAIASARPYYLPLTPQQAQAELTVEIRRAPQPPSPAAAAPDDRGGERSPLGPPN